MHTGPLKIDQEKMSKSLDNFLTIRDALKKYPYEILRFFLLSSHYRSPINFSEDDLEESKSALERLYTAVLGLDTSKAEVLSTTSRTDAFRKAMDDDFNVPEAFAILFDLAKAINIEKEKGEEKKAQSLAKELTTLSEPLGLLQQDPEIFLKSGVEIEESEIDSLIKKREEARANGDYTVADSIRNQLFKDNIILEDSKEGTFWRRR